MPKAKEYVTFVTERGETKARVLAVRTHHVMEGDALKEIVVCDLKVMDMIPGYEEKIDPETKLPEKIKGRVQTFKNVKEGTEPGCWHQ